ncbi:DNA polymerase III subunit beta [Mycoplasmopsis hyopharyngis]|uniref:DNA polymerase III subunit beta n=1 Tax=Mycoplasmopsis hyopharyngis TaxID=29558 RepID=UPI003872ACD2
MNFEIQKNILDKAIEIVSRYSDTANAFYSLRCILIKVTNEVIYLVASNGSQSIEKQLIVDNDKIKVFEEGKFLINTQYFKNSIKKFNQNIIIKFDNDKNLILKEKFTSYSLTTVDPETFIPIEFELPEKFITVNSEQFRKGQKDVEKVVAIDSELIYKCINVKFKDNLMIFGATDTYRLAYEKFKVKNENKYEYEFSLESNYFKDLLPVDVPNEFKLYFDQLKICVVYEQTKIFSRIVDMEFFDLAKLIPSEFKYQIKINKNELLNLIDKVSVVTSEKQNKIEMKIEKNELTLKTFVKEIGTSIAKTTNFNNLTKLELELDLNITFLKDAISVFNDEITLNIDDKVSRILIVSEKDPELKQIITPKRR